VASGSIRRQWLRRASGESQRWEADGNLGYGVERDYRWKGEDLARIVFAWLIAVTAGAENSWERRKNTSCEGRSGPCWREPKLGPKLGWAFWFLSPFLSLSFSDCWGPFCFGIVACSSNDKPLGFVVLLGSKGSHNSGPLWSKEFQRKFRADD
jgi:hypothetical protein